MRIIALFLVLAACSRADPQTITVTEYIDAEIPTVERPRPVKLFPVDFEVVTRDNIDEFIEQLETEYVFVAIDVDEYQFLSLNVDELRRYIEQQNAIITYYEGIANGD